MLVGSVSVFIREAETDQDAGDFESVMHLGNKRDRTAFADEHGLFAKALFEGRLSLQKNRGMEGSHPGFPGAQNFKFAMNGVRQELSNLFFDEPGDFVRLLIGYQPCRKFCKGF